MELQLVSLTHTYTHNLSLVRIRSFLHKSTADSDDYTTVSRTLTFQPGTTSVSFPVTASTDQIDEVQEEFSISLSNPTNDAMLGSDDRARVFIDDGNSEYEFNNKTDCKAMEIVL